MNPKKIGDFGERIACYYLENKGYKILARNYSRKWVRGPQKGEIDIIAKKSDTVSFVEVKTLTESNKERVSVILPEDKVNFQKQRQIIKIAQDWLCQRKISLESKWQIDVISIRVNLDTQKAKIRLFENVVSS